MLSFLNPCTNHIANIAIVPNISMGNLRAVTPSVTVTAELSWLHNGKITRALHRPGARQCYDNCPHCARIVDCMQRSHCSGFKCGVLSSNFVEIRGPAAAALQNQELNVKSSPGQQQQQPRIPGTGWSGEIFCENSILRLSRKFGRDYDVIADREHARWSFISFLVYTYHDM